MQLHTWFFLGGFVGFFSKHKFFIIYLFIYYLFFIYFFKLFKMQQHTCDFFSIFIGVPLIQTSWLGTWHQRVVFFGFFQKKNTLVILIQDGNTTNFYSSISQYTTASGISQYTTACMNMY